MSSPMEVLELSHAISEDCSGKTHDQIMLALMNVIVNIVDHADNRKFTSQTIRYLTDVQLKLVSVAHSSELQSTYSPKEFMVN